MRHALAFALAAVLAGVLVAGCDDAFNPRGDGPPYFGLFGVLDGLSETQLIRVEDIQPPLDSIFTALEARVTVEDATTGTVVTGRDTVLALSDGTEGFAVLVPLAIESGHVYVVTAERLDDPTAQTTATVPIAGPPPLLPMAPISSAGLFSQMVRIPTDGQDLEEIEVAYRLRRTATGEELLLTRMVPVNMLDGAISANISLSVHLRSLRLSLGIDLDDPQALALQQIALRFIQTERDVALFQDGLGSFGWRVRAETSWVLDAETVLALRLIDEQGM